MSKRIGLTLSRPGVSKHIELEAGVGGYVVRRLAVPGPKVIDEEATFDARAARRLFLRYVNDTARELIGFGDIDQLSDPAADALGSWTEVLDSVREPDPGPRYFITDEGVVDRLAGRL